MSRVTNTIQIFIKVAIVASGIVWIATFRNLSVFRKSLKKLEFSEGGVEVEIDFSIKSATKYWRTLRVKLLLKFGLNQWGLEGLVTQLWGCWWFDSCLIDVGSFKLATKRECW